MKIYHRYICTNSIFLCFFFLSGLQRAANETRQETIAFSMTPNIHKKTAIIYKDKKCSQKPAQTTSLYQKPKGNIQANLISFEMMKLQLLISCLFLLLSIGLGKGSNRQFIVRNGFTLWSRICKTLIFILSSFHLFL